MNRIVCLCVLATFAAVAGNLHAQTSVVLYNPLRVAAKYRPSAADEAVVAKRLVTKAKARWSDLDSCGGGNVIVIGAVNGAFTRPGAKQRAIVYELCQIGNGFANNGLAVIENGKVIAHFTEAGGWNLSVLRVRDLTGNGRDELVIETGGGMHQGYEGSSIAVLEISRTSVTEFGRYLAYTNACEEFVANKYCDRSYKITARAGKTPVFFSQRFIDRSKGERPRWVAAGRVLPAQRMDDSQLDFQIVK